MYKSFDRILVPLDLSPTSLISLDHAVFIAKHLKSQLFLLHVKETVSLGSIIKGMFSKADSKAKPEEHVEPKLNEIAENLRKSYGLKVETAVAEGTVYSKILSYASEINATLICMGTHGTTGVETFLGGSNTFRVVNAAKCPVISVHESSGNKGIKDIILPLDSSRDTREKVDDAIYVAKQFNSTIHIIAVSTSTDTTVLNRLRIVAKQVQTYIEEDRIPTTNEFVSGKNLTTLTLDYAKKVSADLIVIMTEQESTAGFLVGPFSQQMINQSNIPIMSVRPKEKEMDFVTPY